MVTAANEGSKAVSDTRFVVGAKNAYGDVSMMRGETVEGPWNIRKNLWARKRAVASWTRLGYDVRLEETLIVRIREIESGGVS